MAKVVPLTPKATVDKDGKEDIVAYQQISIGSISTLTAYDIPQLVSWQEQRGHKYTVEQITRLIDTLFYCITDSHAAPYGESQKEFYDKYRNNPNIRFSSQMFQLKAGIWRAR